LAPENRSLNKSLKHFDVLNTIHDCLAHACGLSEGSAEDIILRLHLSINDTNLTKFLVQILWRLMAPEKEQEISQLLENGFLTGGAKSPSNFNDHYSVPGLSLEYMLRDYQSGGN